MSSEQWLKTIDFIQDAYEAGQADNLAAGLAKLAAMAATGAIAEATLRTAFPLIRLGYAVSGRINQWEKWSAFGGWATGEITGKLIDEINDLHLGGRLYDWLHPDVFDRAKKWTWPRDPLTLDLDGDGIETVALTAGLHFDHNADGIQTGTGWVKGDDAFLVRDINGNGIIDASDAAFAELNIWQDLNQDGISQADELKTLFEAGIASLNLAATLKNQSLGNGNTLAREGSFTRVDGTIGKTGDLNLAVDTFNTRFAESIPVAEAVKALPNMAGSGKVRELWQAASQSGSLQSLLAEFAAASTREAQRALLDPILSAWADTSGLVATLDDRDPDHYRIEYLAFGSLRRSDHLIVEPVEGSGSFFKKSGVISHENNWRIVV